MFNEAIKNIHLIKIVLEYMQYELKYKQELLRNTEFVYNNTLNIINYDNYYVVNGWNKYKEPHYKFRYRHNNNHWIIQ